MTNASLPLHQVLEEEFISLHGVLPDAHYTDNKTPDARLKAIYQRIHALENKRAALCISGGGIRSATFALGVLSGLARLGMLQRFDFLSTVSGGGYVGSWLTAWIHRDPAGASGVFDQMRNRPQSAMEPEPRTIRHLRAYSNYLSPSLGLLSADTWTLVATISRNMLLNWTVFFPLLGAALMIPRFCVAVIRIEIPTSYKTELLTAVIIMAFLAGVIAVGYMSLFRPSFRKYREKAYKRAASQAGFLNWCLVPTLIMAVLLSIYWGWLRNADISIEEQVSPIFKLPIRYPWPFFLFGLSLHVIAWLGFAIWSRRFQIMEFIVAVGVGFTAGVLLWFSATRIFPKPVFDGDASIPETELFVCFSLPLIVGLLLLSVALFVGLSSRFTEDEDREWFARFGAWGLIAIVGWSAISSLIIFGPEALLRLSGLAKTTVASIGGISGLLVALLGRSSKTAANRKQKGAGKPSTLRNIALALAAPTFVLIFLTALSLATSALIVAIAPSGADKVITSASSTRVLPSIEGALDQLRVVHNSSIPLLLLLIFAMLLVGLGMAFFININKFSLHSMYRNRIIRAYLGASRLNRRENPFTGFDPDDNISMHELRPERFRASSFRRVESLKQKLDDTSNPVSQYLQRRFASPRNPKALHPTTNGGSDVAETLAMKLNEVLDGPNIYEETRFQGVALNESTRRLLNQEPTGNSLAVLNRLLIEQAYPREFKHFRGHRPLHVINMSLNLVGGKNLAWQQRKAESFSSSPLHSGCYCISDPVTDSCGSYRPSIDYGGHDGISLGTAVAISGAAVSPNMGYHSSAPITFLLTLFNARLGWWLGNPGTAGERTYTRNGPLFSIGPLIDEALGLTDDENSYVYLSDGGHFENLAIYEMVLRRCHYIVVSDGSQDAECEFDDLGGALRKIRVDLGVPITIEKINIYSRKSDKVGKYCAVGRIHYSAVDGGDPEKTDGVLIYIKPAICGGEPADVFNYAQRSKLFPHESTADQFFSETQFESYRMLGLHSIQQMSAGFTGATLADWANHLSSVYLV